MNKNDPDEIEKELKKRAKRRERKKKEISGGKNIFQLRALLKEKGRQNHFDKN